jgi:hypothetical protein
METDNKKVFAVMGVVALFLVSIIISQYYGALSKADLTKKRKTEYGGLHFSGKVMHCRVYKYLNKSFYQVCVKLDSPNVKPVIVYNDDDAIKVSNGTATFSGGYIKKFLGLADSVAVNMHSNGKIIFYRTGYMIDKKDFAFDPMGLQRDDLNNCN